MLQKRKEKRQQMADEKRTWVTVWMGRMAWLSVVLWLLVSGLASNLAAQEKPPLSSTNQEQIIVYVYTLATTVSISVDGLTIYRTDSYSHQGLWNHQFNLSSWLDTETQTITVKARFGSRDSAYCTLEVRSARASAPTPIITGCRRWPATGSTASITRAPPRRSRRSVNSN